jgi:hypothetical protein
MNEPVAWIGAIDLAYMDACKVYGIKDFKITLGLVPEDGDMPLYIKAFSEIEQEVITKIIEASNNLSVQEIADISMHSSDMNEHGHSQLDEKLFVKNLIKKVLEKSI